MMKALIACLLMALSLNCNADRCHLKMGVAFDINPLFGTNPGAYIENKDSSIAHLQSIENEDPNPLGTIIFDCKMGDHTLFFIQHVTSIPNEVDGAGLNFAGFLWEF